MSSEIQRSNAGGDINSHNTIRFHRESVHHHVHHHNEQSTSFASTNALLRCPLPSPKFVGRRAELSRLREFFTSSDPGHKTFAVIGMGGCGKSQTASQFFHGHVLEENMYDHQMVFFVDGTTEITLQEGFASIARCKRIGSSWQDGVAWLSNTSTKSFTFIDNMDSPNIDLKDYIPRSTKAHVLITTRLYDEGRLYASADDAFIDLDALPIEDAEEMLIRTAMIAPERRTDATALVQELHCHALAIAQAGACIAHLRLAVDQYLERLRRLGTSFMDGKNDAVGPKALYGYSKVVSISWKTSYDELPPLSMELFSLCAFLHHTGITQMLFQKASDSLKSFREKQTVPFSPSEDIAFASVTKILTSYQDDKNSFDDFAFQKSTSPIFALSLMRCDPVTQILSIHPLVLNSLQHIVCNHLPTSMLLVLAITYDDGDTPFLYRLLPHVDSVVERFTVLDGPSQSAHCHPDMAAAFSSVYMESRRFSQAESLQRACMTRRTADLGSNHESTLRALSSLSWTLKESGQLTDAEDMGRSVREAWIRDQGENHVDTRLASIRLAATLFERGQYDEAEKIQRDVLLRCQRMLGDENLDTITAIHNLAMTLTALGRYEEAVEKQLEVVSVRKRLLGEGDLATLWAMHSLAALGLRPLGRNEEAETMQQDVLCQRRRRLGNDHPDTVWVMSDLASTLSSLGRYEEGETMQVEVLSRRRSILGEDHPQTLWTMNHLAGTLSDLRRYEEAETIQLELLSRRRRVLGENHPDTIWAMDNLASTLSSLGRDQEAEPLQRDILSQRRRLLGEDHPHTLWAMVSLASTLSFLGRYKEAEPIQVEVLARQKRILGEDHPWTYLAMYHLMVSLSSLGRYEEAEAMRLHLFSRRTRLHGDESSDTVLDTNDLAPIMTDHEWEQTEHLQSRVLASQKRNLGEDHPATLTSMVNLAITLCHLKRYHEAEKLHQEGVERRRRVLGQDHPQTTQSVEELAKTSALRKSSQRALEERSHDDPSHPGPLVEPVSQEATSTPLSESDLEAPSSATSDPQPRVSRRRKLVEKLKTPFRRF